MAHPRIDDDLDRLLAAARPANPAADAAVRGELDALVARALPDAHRRRRRVGWSIGAGFGALLFIGVGSSAATAVDAPGDHAVTVVNADEPSLCDLSTMFTYTPLVIVEAGGQESVVVTAQQRTIGCG